MASDSGFDGWDFKEWWVNTQIESERASDFHNSLSGYVQSDAYYKNNAENMFDRMDPFEMICALGEYLSVGKRSK